MSIFKKTKSITRYDVSGLPEKDGEDIIKVINDGLNAFSFLEIGMGEEMSWGWSGLFNQFESSFDSSSFMFGNFVGATLRIDRKIIPGKVFKKALYFAEKKAMEDNQVPKLSRASKVMIKEAVKAELLKTTPATPTSYDVLWDVGAMKLSLFSTQKLAREVIEDIMRESFNLELSMIFPFTMAEKTQDESEIEKLSETNFAL